jgi:Lon-like protease
MRYLREIAGSEQLATRRLWPWALLAGVILVLVVGGFGIHLSGFVVQQPGPVKNVEDAISIKDAKTYPSKGSLSLTTVAFTNDPTPADLLLALVDPNKAVISTSDLIQSGSYKQLLREERLQMVQSKRDAIETALGALGYKKATGDGAKVVYVQNGAPASGYLEAGDVIHSINGHKVTTACDVGQALDSRPPGADARFLFDRKGKSSSVGFATGDNPNEPGRQAYAGIGITTDKYHYDPGVNVKIDTRGIGGPSAGTIMALTIYDRLTPGDLTGGKRVAGTGTIEPCKGEVGPIGGIQDKVVAANEEGISTFLAPADDAAEARKADHGDMKIITIRTFKQAVGYLKAHA